MQQTININLSIDELETLIKSAVQEALNETAEPTQSAENAEPDELLKIGDVAKMFRVSTVTIFDWKKKGKLPFHRIARKVYFKRSEVLKALSKIDKIGA